MLCNIIAINKKVVINNLQGKINVRETENANLYSGSAHINLCPLPRNTFLDLTITDTLNGV